jgi:epoxyqueuosine reductase QueG
VAYIDPEKCKLCRKCVAVCPTGAIREEGFISKKDYAERQETEKDKSNQNKLKSCFSGS